MGCGGSNGVRGIFGRIPPQQRFVSEGAYEVKAGDDVADICYTFGIAIDRWQELVGANLHKPLEDEPPYGYRHRCFKSLDAGEKLNIPGGWGPGAVSGPLFSNSASKLSPIKQGVKMDQMGAMITAMNQLGVGSGVQNVLAAAGISMPTNVTIEDAMAVAYSWWPYARFPNTPPGQTPPLPTPANPTPVAFTSMVALVKQAVEFLRSTGIIDGASTAVQNIPWDAILWKDVPWKVLGAQVMQEISQAMLGTPIPAYTTPPLTVPNQSPDFFTTSWEDQKWVDILKDVNFSDSLTDILGDPEAVKCIRENTDRFKKLAGCEQCYEDTEQFKKILCSNEPADPCNCDEPAPPGPEEPTKSQDEDKTTLIVAASVIGVLGIAATAFALNRRK